MKPRTKTCCPWWFNFDIFRELGAVGFESFRPWSSTDVLSPDEEAELEASEWRRLAVAVWRLLPAQRCGLSVLAFVTKALIRCLLFFTVCSLWFANTYGNRL